jgi:hypothetical protein
MMSESDLPESDLTPLIPPARRQGGSRRPLPQANGLKDNPFFVQARSLFQELASAALSRCELSGEMSRTVLHSLELAFSRTLKEDGPAMQRQFGQDAMAAAAWATERLLESCRHMATVIPGQRKTQLQSLAAVEVQVLELMLPELSHLAVEVPAAGSVPATYLRSFCALLNDGLDLAQKATAAAARNEVATCRRNIERSQISLREAGRLLRCMRYAAGPETTDLTDGLRGFQLELAAHAGSLRLFLKALHSLDSAPPSRHRQKSSVRSHCLINDLLPTLFHWHFEFTICTPRDIPANKTQELLAAAHGSMWKKVEDPISRLLANTGSLQPSSFKQAVESELQRAIEEVNRELAGEHVVVSITATNTRQIKRRIS